jgi:hypothetical protein
MTAWPRERRGGPKMFESAGGSEPQGRTKCIPNPVPLKYYRGWQTEED